MHRSFVVEHTLVGKVVGFRSVRDAVQEGITIGRIGRGEGNDIPLDKDPAVTRLDKTRVWPVVRFTGGKSLLCIPLEFSVNDSTGKPEATRTQVSYHMDTRGEGV